MGMAKGVEEPMFGGIDLDRVIVDPDYRRRVIDRLRAEAATQSSSNDPEPAPASGLDD
ncbi:MAG: hypothetical protein ACLQJR_14570 [Stellaceae bacterium]